MRRCGLSCWNEAARCKTGERNAHELEDHHRRSDRRFGGQGAGHKSEQDRKKSCGFDQRIAGDEFSPLQMIGQNAIFDRAEKRRDHAQSEQRRVKKQKRRQPKSGGSDHLNQNLGRFQPADDQRLVMRIADLAPEPGQHDRRQHENADGEANQGAGFLCAKPKQQEHGEHVADEIIVEGGQKLAPEQRRKAARAQKLEEHHRRLVRTIIELTGIESNSLKK